MLKTIVRVPKVEDLVFGGAPIGCLYEEVSEEQAKGAIEAAVKAGITYFDTAPLYGTGLSEERIGKYCPENVQISTKCGLYLTDKSDLTRKDKFLAAEHMALFHTSAYHDKDEILVEDRTIEGTIESVRQSKERLRRPVTCLRLHDVETKSKLEQAIAPGGAVDAMVEMKKKGEITEVSLGMNYVEWIDTLLFHYPAGTFDSLMIAGSWNLIDQSAYHTLIFCENQNIEVINASVFCGGLLFGGNYYRYKSPVPDEVKEKVAKWKALCEKHKVDLHVVALTFAFIPAVVKRVAIGMGSAEQVEKDVALCGQPVPNDLWQEAQTLGLIRSDVDIVHLTSSAEKNKLGQLRKESPTEETEEEKNKLGQLRKEAVAGETEEEKNKLGQLRKESMTEETAEEKNKLGQLRKESPTEETAEEKKKRGRPRKEPATGETEEDKKRAKEEKAREKMRAREEQEKEKEKEKEERREQKKRKREEQEKEKEEKREGKRGEKRAKKRERGRSRRRKKRRKERKKGTRGSRKKMPRSERNIRLASLVNLSKAKFHTCFPGREVMIYCIFATKSFLSENPQ